MPVEMKTRTLYAPILLALAVALTGCGGGNSNSTNTSGNASATPADRAFIAEMIPHHQMAIDMAKMAKDNGEHAEIKSLASDVIKAQQSEITQLKSIDAKLRKAGVKKGDLGVPASKSGMNMKMSDLQGAKPFDKKFIDMMVPHHQGAITMAKAELAKGKDPSLRDIANKIISAQQAEVTKMQSWRKKWYGSSMDPSMNMG